MIHGGEPAPQASISLCFSNAALQPDRSLRHRGGHLIAFKNTRRPRTKPETVEPSNRQKRRVDRACVKFGEPCIHVAPIEDDLKIRPPVFDQSRSAHRRRPNHRPLWQRVQITRDRRKERISGILARKNTSNLGAGC